MKTILRNLEDVAVLVGGGTPSRTKSEYFDGDVPWVTPSDLPPKGNVRPLGPVAEAITRIGLLNSSATLLPPGTVLLSTRATIGKIAVADRECSTNQGFCNFIPAVDVIDSWYLAYYLAAVTEDIVALAGQTTFREVGRKKLRALSILVPPLHEQRRVVGHLNECMERIDEIGDLRDQGIRESNLIESVIFHDSLHARYQNSRWPVVNLDHLTKSSRYGTSKKAGRDPVGIPVLRMGNIVGGYVDYSDLKYADLVENEKNKYLLHYGDVLINRTNSLELVGKAATFDRRDGEWIYASYLVRIRVNTSRVLPEYVTATINSRVGRSYVLATARRAIGMVNINAREMAGFPIPLPPLEVQRRIVDRLAEARHAGQQIRARLGATDADLLRNAVLRRAFAGDL